MFTVKTKGFAEPLFTELVQQIVDLPRNLESLALEATVQLEEDLSKIYTTAPPRGNEKFIWSTDPAANKRARGWWFWQIGLGNIPSDGRHYKRQGKPPYGVTANLSQGQHAVQIAVVMKDPKMRFPFGQLQAKNSQLPGHQRTGWSFAYPLVSQAMQNATNTIVDGLFATLENV